MEAGREAENSVYFQRISSSSCVNNNTKVTGVKEKKSNERNERNLKNIKNLVILVFTLSILKHLSVQN